MSGSYSCFAVVMGDLVRSESSVATEYLHTRFNAAVDRANQVHDGIASPLTITLGDEFQGLTTTLAGALPIVRAIRFDLLSNGIECRFAVGSVDLKSPLNVDRAWNMMGPGLSRTRAKLNEKKAVSLYRFAVANEEVTETTLDALGAGLTAIERRWTEQQRSDIIASLDGATAQDIAERRNVSAHTVYKVRSSGAFDAYVLQWHAIHEALARIDQQSGMA